jgi:serine/threonine protein phosphatase 1
MIDLAALAPDTVASRVYAVGDIHGRLDLLLRIEAQIEADLAVRPTASPLVCYLGDYIDRGPASAGVVEHLVASRRDNLRCVFLKGNHEDRMLAFLDEPAGNGPRWMTFGGRELETEDWDAIRDRLATAVPGKHLAFLRSLDLALRWGDYLFVHAGLDPARGLEAQDPHDLMWIREPFLSSDRDWGVRVVHGHVIAPEPVLRPNRIGLDTGAYKSGILTCAAIDDGALRILQTSTLVG